MPESHEVARPYPGLRPFESWEGEIFFGREEHTNRLLDILQQQRFLAVIGPSGSGKSSLVRAGLLPALPLGSLGTGSDWRIALLRPGNRPTQRLAHALLGRSALGIELVGEERIPQDERHLTADVALIEAELRRGPLGLIEVVKDARTRQTGEEPFNLLVLVDQFEEIFTYADAGGRQADESEAFVNLLLASRTAPEARIYIVLTMRTDFLGNCVRFLELPDAINRAQYLTPRLSREQIERAITGPAHLFEGDVEPTLVAELINAVSNDPDQLPILQHALARMWDKANPRGTKARPITWDHSSAVGGITDALSSHANEILASLSPKKEIEEPPSPAQRTVEVLFRAITGQRSAEAGGQAVRRPQSLDQIGKWSGRDCQEFIPVVRAFAQENVNFLNYVGELTAETVVDISHEALIRQWGTLRDWVTDEAKLAAEYRRWRERAEAKAAGSGALLTGADLARAVEWRDGSAWKSQSFCKPTPAWASRYRRTSDEPSNSEFQNVLGFIDESAKNRDKEQASQERRKFITFVSICVVAVASVIVAAVMNSWRQTAEAEQNKAVTLNLVGEGRLAEDRYSNQLQLHALLAIESTKRFPSPLANHSLRHALDLMPRPLTTMLHQDSVSAVSFSPDGKTLASGSGDKTVRVWDLATGKELRRWPHEQIVTAVSFSPDGKTLASGSQDNAVWVWDLATGKEQQRWSHGATVNAVSFSPDGKTLASGSEDKTVRVWDLATGKELRRRWSHEAAVNAVSFSPDGKTLVSGSKDKTVRVWDLATGKELHRWLDDYIVNAVSFSPDGKTLASGSEDRTVRVWDLATGKELRRWSHEDNVTAVSFSPDGKTLASGSQDRTVRVWDLATGKELHRGSYASIVNAVSFSPDGKTLASGSGDNTVRLWDLATGKELQRWSHEAAVNAVSFSPDGKTLASGSGDRRDYAFSFSPDGKIFASGSGDSTIRVWDPATGKELYRGPYASIVNAVSVSPDGKTLASGSGDGTVRLWEVATGKELHRWSDDSIVNAVSFSPDGKTLASGSGKLLGGKVTNIRVWDLATGKELHRWSDDYIVNAVSFSPDGKTLASGSGDNTVRLWDLATGKELQRWSHEAAVNAVSFSPDGKTLASGSGNFLDGKGTIRVWDLATGKELQRWSHEGNVNTVTFSPDGKTLASGSEDNTARLWDLATGKELHRLSHEDWVNAVSFSPDGKTLASGSGDILGGKGTMRVWLWQPSDLMLAVCERSSRNLSWDEWKLYFEDLAYAKTCEHLPVHESVVAHAQQLARAGNLPEATALFQRISDIEPSATLDPIGEADRWERKGKAEKIWASADKLREEKKYGEWMGVASEAVQLDPTAVPNKDWNEVCWNGALDGQAPAVMRACDRAVERAGGDDLIHNIRDSRGLARALTGNTQGAIEDFEFFIEHTDNTEQKSQRQAWMGALKAGKNPFTPEVLQSLQGQ